MNQTPKIQVSTSRNTEAATADGVLLQCGPDMIRTLSRALEMIDEASARGEIRPRGAEAKR